MIKTYTLLAALFLCILSARSNDSEFRIVAVDPIENKVTIQNVSGAPMDVGTWWLCSERKFYSQINKLTASSTMLGNNEKLVVTFTLEDENGDAALYINSAFGTISSIKDFMQWGAAGQGRETVADLAGIWEKGDFLEGSGPFIYTGNFGTDTGIDFWQQANVSTRQNFTEIFKSSLYPNPVLSTATLELSRQLNLEDVEVRIYDLLGSEVKIFNDLENHIITFDRQNLLKGIYFYSISKAGKVLDTVKFSVN